MTGLGLNDERSRANAETGETSGIVSVYAVHEVGAGHNRKVLCCCVDYASDCSHANKFVVARV